MEVISSVRKQYPDIHITAAVSNISFNLPVRKMINLGFTVLPSQANFVFARHSQLPGETLYRKLKENGVLVRWFDADRIRDYIRITIGSMEQMETLVEELTAILEEL